MSEEKGILFCGNCGHTEPETKTYKEFADENEKSCEVCGFDDAWIFEPTADISIND